MLSPPSNTCNRLRCKGTLCCNTRRSDHTDLSSWLRPLYPSKSSSPHVPLDLWYTSFYSATETLLGQHNTCLPHVRLHCCKSSASLLSPKLTTTDVSVLTSISCKYWTSERVALNVLALDPLWFQQLLYSFWAICTSRNRCDMHSSSVKLEASLRTSTT